MNELHALLARFTALSAEAGARVVEVRSRSYGVASKSDGSPLTEADLAADAVIAAGLPRAAPGIPVVSEEDALHVALRAGAPFILVDPLDGTREFLGPSGEFTVNIALIEDGVPACGVVYAPALGMAWRGIRGKGAQAARLAVGDDPSRAEWRTIQARPRPAADWTAVASRSHMDAETTAFLAGLPIGEHRSIGSSIKFCLLAQGEADVYPRFGPTMEWDTAAGQAVLEAAGGRVETPAGAPFRYGKTEQGFLNGAFIAWGA
ncbi:3'(2'),5'-bisphosphate nucleotidase CysQ [Falsiroseomonas stagni]|uniref:3'(2'),5'-bisphosphate nucleotidase CysQ n=1 Tax=Falsiroseomonas stagni DSM 19981 TaxID=1123062 RepID=A0A1I4BHC7_9PROT|nr:3'(2'),5'-bisphosphate nucleotidase CysQ [Falsiroseomonas stagni]SFK68235.1 3'(2'),5'-bisphosphate nucleotidase [Falsiroseomonas stagni DSM 19981]